MFEKFIVCDGVKTTELPACDFSTLILLVKNLITNMVIISTFLAVAVFAYVGILFLTSGGSGTKKTKAVGMLWKVVWGYLWILFAWLIVYTITTVLLNPGYTLFQ